MSTFDKQAAPGGGVDLAALRHLASEATPGPWKQEPQTAAGRVWVKTRSGDCEPLFNIRSDKGYEQRANDAGFIAACDPQTVLALVEAVEAAVNVDILADMGEIESHVLGAGSPLRRLRAALAPFRQEQPDEEALWQATRDQAYEEQT